MRIYPGTRVCVCAFMLGSAELVPTTSFWHTFQINHPHSLGLAAALRSAPHSQSVSLPPVICVLFSVAVDYSLFLRHAGARARAPEIAIPGCANAGSAGSRPNKLLYLVTKLIIYYDDDGLTIYVVC